MSRICRCNKSDYGEDHIDSISRLARRSGDCLSEHQNSNWATFYSVILVLFEPLGKCLLMDIDGFVGMIVI